MKHRKLHITILFLLMWSFSFSQQYTNYSTKDGLPSNHVYTIVQDAKGFMWFLTDKGMARFNGEEIQNFTTKNGLPINDVWDAFPTPDGKVWYICKTTKLGYIENDTIISFPNKNEKQLINPTFTSQIGNSIYPTEPTKSFTLQNNTWVEKLNKNSKNRKLDWIQIRHKTTSYITFRKADDKLLFYNKDLKLIDSVATKNIYGESGARGQLNDSLFFWTNNKKYSILNLNTNKLKQVVLNEKIKYNAKTYPRINLFNNEIQITGDGFVAKLNNQLDIVNPFYFPEHINAHFGFIDKQNTIWLTTFNNGIYKLPKVKKNIEYVFGNEKIQSISTINNKLIIGVFNKGLYAYNNKNKTVSEFLKNKDYIYGATEIKELNTIFYSFRYSLVKEVNKNRTQINLNNNLFEETSTNSLGRKFLFVNNKLYGNTSFGINKLNSKTLELEKQFPQKGINDIIKYKNQIIIATTNGLKLIKNDSLITVKFTNFKFDKSVLSLNVLDSKLLINTDGFGSYTSNLQTIEPLKQTEFLIVEDSFVEENTLWLATNEGVLNFEKNNNDYKLNRTLTEKDGLPTNHINTLYVDNQDLIVGTNNGLAILPKEQRIKSELLDLYINEAKYNDKTILETSKFKYEVNNALNFKVSSIDYSENSENLSYQYKLEPLQREWTTTTSKNISFNSLQPKEYNLKVKVNAIEKALQFEISPLWWQQTWFRIVAVLLSFFGVFYISRVFVKRYENKKNQRLLEDKRMSELQLEALRSQMNPHFVFNSLAAIQYYINNNEMETSEVYLVKFSKLIRQFFDLSKETEITLNREIKLLENYLEIEKLRFKQKLEFKFIVDKNLNIEKTAIPTMLLQPIVENAVNHGIFNKEENGLVTLRFMNINEQSYKIEIIDDGVGFENTKKRYSKKMKSSNVLNDRLRYLNQTKQWNITYNKEELFPEKTNKGNISTFSIQALN